jgi:tetratricopeptide (TPR) repeat protein
MIRTSMIANPKWYAFIIHAFDAESIECAKRLAEILSLINIMTVTGKDLNGMPLTSEVRQRLKSAKVVIAVLTPDPDHDGLPSPWTLQEIALAVDNNLPCILVVEEGLAFDAGIAGDLEQIRFAPGDFASVLVRVANQVQTLMSLGVDISSTAPSPFLHEHVRLLIYEAREHAKKRRWAEVLRVSDEALRLDPKAVSAAINKGVALVHLGHLVSAERLFQRILEEFPDANNSQLSKAHQNLAWVEEVRDAGRFNPKSLRKQVRHQEKSLLLDPRNVYARASLLLCRVALEEFDEAHALLMESVNRSSKFLKALHHVVETRGATGHRLVSRLPDWLYSILFPTWHEDDDDDDEGGPLAA